METSAQTPRNTTNLRIAAVLVVVSGAVALVGHLLGWAKATYPTQEGGGLASVVQATVGHGRAALFLGLFLLAAGIIALVIPSREVKRSWLIVGIACGIALGALAVYDLITLRSSTVDHLVGISTGTGFSPGQIARLIMFSFEPGIYAAVVAGGLALVAAVLLFMGRSRPVHPEAEPVALESDQP
jgi:hypothetical protein